MQAPPAQSPGYETRHIDAAKGRGIFATKRFETGDTIFQELPVASLQHYENRSQVVACENCCKFIGSLSEQLSVLTGGEVSGLPDLPKISNHLSPIVRCTQGCGEVYCSEACRSGAFERHHKILCVGPITDESHPLVQFKVHAISHNEIFLLAGKVIAQIITAFHSNGGDLTRAFGPYAAAQKTAWWNLALPADVPHEEREQWSQGLRHLIYESHQILLQAITAIVPAAAQLFTLDFYANIVGMFELNNHSIDIPSPVERYVRSIIDSPHSESIYAKLPGAIQELVLQYKAFLAAEGDGDSSMLDDEFHPDDAFPSFQGTGFFTLLSTANHSCDPNVQLHYDGNHLVSLKAVRDILEGEELCVSYIDEHLDVEDRTAELNDYNFVCQCRRCIQERKH